MSNIKTFSRKADGNNNISENFKVREFACNDGSDTILIDMDMVYILQWIRNQGGQVTINSAYRTARYNARVGGASNSYHTKGMAFDITAKQLTLTELCNLAKTLGVKGIIRYPEFVHIDNRENKYHADNYGKLLNFGSYSVDHRLGNLKLGSKGLEVAVLQYKLNKLGFNCGTVDGDFGNKTYEAVKKYQSQFFLTPDGIVGLYTWNKLFNQ